MATRVHPTFVKGLTVAVALTLMSGFVFYRHRGGSPSPRKMMSAAPIDSPETGATTKQVHLDSFYFDRSMPSSKSGMIVPPDHPAFQQPQIRLDTPKPSTTERTVFSSSKSVTIAPLFLPEDRQRTMLYSSKCGVVFESPPSAIVNDSLLNELKAQDTIK